MSDARAVVEDDIRTARTLPVAFYRDAAVFERAREKVFARSWQHVDGAAAMRRTASALPFELLPGCLDEPLVLVRDAKGTTRCLSNVCTHRGNVVCTEPGEVGGLRCGYHGRKFTLEGKMIAMPEFEGVHDFPTPRDDLKEIRLGTLGPLVFAALPPAFSFDELPVPARERFAFLDKPSPARSGPRQYDVNATWAVSCDKFPEGFRVPFVHPGLAKTME